MSTKKLSTKEIADLKKQVKELMEGGLTQTLAITQAVEPYGITYNQAYYRYFNKSYKRKRSSYKALANDVPAGSEFSGSLKFSMDLVQNVWISDNTLVISFK